MLLFRQLAISFDQFRELFQARVIECTANPTYQYLFVLSEVVR